METPNSEVVKDVTEVVVDEKDASSSRSSSAPVTPNQAWQTGVRQRMPWLGVVALTIVILCAVGQLLVLLFSDARAASDWPSYITPNVCLSILNGISTIAITLAVGQGIAISWWRRALLGASIKELHYTWSFSTSLTSIFIKYKYFNAIALAALMTKVAVVDGVLFQRASGTYIDISWNQAAHGSAGSSNVFAWSQPTFPVTGERGPTNTSAGETSYAFSMTLWRWIDAGSGLNTNDTVLHCDGFACDYNLPGAGFAIDCTTNTTIETFVDDAASQTASSNATIFSVDFGMYDPDTTLNFSRIEIRTKFPTGDYSSDGAAVCPTNFTYSTCILRPALMNYTVNYNNATGTERSKLNKKNDIHGSTTLDAVDQSGSQLGYSCYPRSLDRQNAESQAEWDNCGSYVAEDRQIKGVQVVQNMDLYEPWSANANSSLLGIYNALKDQFTSSVTLTYHDETWSAAQSGIMAPITEGPPPVSNDMCNYTYNSPNDYIFGKLNSLTFRMSVDRNLWPANLSWQNGGFVYPNDVEADHFYKDVYYSTNYDYAGAALGLTLLVILCILPSYWGFWQLGRNVTLGPMEIAYAFQGPAFAAVHGVNGQADQVVGAVGRTRVQYGQVKDGDGQRLAFKMA